MAGKLSACYRHFVVLVCGFKKGAHKCRQCKRPRAKDDADVWLHPHLYMLQAANRTAGTLGAAGRPHLKPTVQTLNCRARRIPENPTPRQPAVGSGLRPCRRPGSWGSWRASLRATGNLACILRQAAPRRGGQVRQAERRAGPSWSVGRRRRKERRPGAGSSKGVQAHLRSGPCGRRAATSDPTLA